jgi:hypothetical protein
VYPEGEACEWNAFDQPTAVTAEELETDVRNLAIASLLARHWPRVAGSRHEVALSASGLLLRAGLDVETVSRMIAGAAKYDGGEEDRTADVRTTAAKLASGQEVTGGPTLAGLLGGRAVATLEGWLPTPTTRIRSFKSPQGDLKSHTTEGSVTFARSTNSETAWCQEQPRRNALRRGKRADKMPYIWSENRTPLSQKRREAQKRVIRGAFRALHPDAESLTAEDLSTLLNAVAQEGHECEHILEILYRSNDAPHKKAVVSWAAHFRGAVLNSAGKAPRPPQPKFHRAKRASADTLQAEDDYSPY